MCWNLHPLIRFAIAPAQHGAGFGPSGDLDKHSSSLGEQFAKSQIALLPTRWFPAACMFCLPPPGLQLECPLWASPLAALPRRRKLTMEFEWKITRDEPGVLAHAGNHGTWNTEVGENTMSLRPVCVYMGDAVSKKKSLKMENKTRRYIIRAR